MYPQADLELLAQRKRALVQGIRVHRQEIGTHLATTLRPVEWGARIYAQWKAISPALKIAAVPVGLLIKEKFMPKAGAGLLGGVLKWAPVALDLFRGRR